MAAQEEVEWHFDVVSQNMRNLVVKEAEAKPEATTQLRTEADEKAASRRKLAWLRSVIALDSPEVVCLQELSGGVESMRALRRWFREQGYESDGVCGEVVPGGQTSSGHGGILIAWRTAEFSADRQHRARPGLAVFTETAIQEAAGQRGLSAGSPHLMAARRYAGHRALYVQLRRRRGHTRTASWAS